MKRLRKFLPVVVSVVLLVVLVSYAPWGEVAHTLSGFSPLTILALVLLSLAYHGVKAVRFQYLLKAMNIHQPLGLVVLSYMAAQPVSLLPAGEVYRSHQLEKHTEVPIKQSLAQFIMQGVFEGAAMASLAVISALALGTLRIAAIALLVLVVGVIIGIRLGYLEWFIHVLNHLPFVNVTSKTIKQFNKRNKAVLTGRWLPILYGISIAVELIGAAIAYTSVVGVGGHINVFQAVLVYVIPIVVGFFSLLPGGIGVSEQSAIGVLLLSNISVARAVAATLIMRVTIVGLGVLYGFIALAIGQERLRRQGRPLLEA